MNSADGWPGIEVRGVELVEVALPLVRPFRTSFGEEREKRAVLVRVDAGDVEGGGECVAASSPSYSGEWLEGAWLVMERHLVPSLVEGGPLGDPNEVGRRLSWARGHRMSKAAVESAVLDAALRAMGRPLASYVGAVRDRVPCGVSVGIASSIDELLEEIGDYLASGYRRIKLKIEPGRDVDVARVVRETFADAPVSVDANAAYSPADLATFHALDDLGLVMIEQPFHHEDLLQHAELQARLRTPICLDESIRSAADTAAAIAIGACRVVNIKPGRVGGPLEARRVHDVASESGVPVWIGGMLETGVGRALNLTLAALPGVTMPGDTSASDRYFEEDITDPYVLASDGTMAVPSVPGIGPAPREDRLRETTTRRELVTA